MGSLIAGMLEGLGMPAGLVGDTTPYVPSTPVEIGTSGVHHNMGEARSWQVLLVMFAVVLGLGTAVLLYAVRQRTRVLERRRVRRMGETAALMAAMDGAGDAVAPIAIPADVPIGTLTLIPPTPPGATPGTPGRSAPNA